jgi:hypothetical protein
MTDLDYEDVYDSTHSLISLCEMYQTVSRLAKRFGEALQEAKIIVPFASSEASLKKANGYLDSLKNALETLDEIVKQSEWPDGIDDDIIESFKTSTKAINNITSIVDDRLKSSDFEDFTETIDPKDMIKKTYVKYVILLKRLRNVVDSGSNQMYLDNEFINKPNASEFENYV